jgi:hypothetical protein
MKIFLNWTSIRMVTKFSTETLDPEDINQQLGRAIAQAVSRWLLTAAAQVQTRVWSSGVCGGQSDAGVGFLLVLPFPLPIFIPSNSPSS